jgi:hypothetical protein
MTDNIQALTARIDDLNRCCNVLQHRLDELAALTPGITEAKVKEIVAAAIPRDVQAIAHNVASRTVVEALAAIGTSPAKPTPVGSAETPEVQASSLITAGKYEEAWAADPKLQREFLSASSCAAFFRAQKRGGVSIATK